MPCDNVIDVLGITRTNKEIITIAGVSEEPRLFDPDGPLIPVEINLEELPLFLFQARGRTAQRILESRDTILLDSGERLEKYFKVTGSEEFGLPGPSDRDVYLAVIRLMQRSGGMPPDGRVGFSLYEILNVLGITDGANNYANIRRSIDRIGATLVYAENGFYNRQGEIFETHRFQPWRPFFRQTKARGRRSERHVVRFDELLVKSYHSNYLKTLDADFHFSLENDLAKLLYGLIDVRRAGTLTYSEEIYKLRRLIPLPDSYRQPSRIKRRLKPAYSELIRRGFLTRVDFEEHGSTEMIRHRISPGFVHGRDVFSAGLTRFERETLDRLTFAGVWPARARGVIASHGADQCAIFLDALSAQKRLRNPAAWVVQAIENDWRDALVKGQTLVGSSRPVPLPPTREPEVRLLDPPDPVSPHPVVEKSIADGPVAGILDVADTEPSEDAHKRARERAQDRIGERYEMGEFDAAISAWETIPYDQFQKFVATRSPVAADASENRYYLSLSGDLYLCLEPNSVAEHHRVYITTLDRSTLQ